METQTEKGLCCKSPYLKKKIEEQKSFLINLQIGVYVASEKEIIFVIYYGKESLLSA